jgi:Cd2+/Zn2+-exporting ATPase
MVFFTPSSKLTFGSHPNSFLILEKSMAYLWSWPGRSFTYSIELSSFSNHPIAKSIINLSNKPIDSSGVTKYKEITGEGITFQLDGKEIKIGTVKVCNCKEDTNLHLNIDGKHVASITINDGIKENVHESIAEFKKLGIRTYMFTGDKKNVALGIGNKLGIDDIKFEMLPTDKYREYEKIVKPGDVIAFVGDGINDAPVLKRSDIGISMGGVGSSSAIEASDIVIMNDDIGKIPKAISISKYTKYIVMQNLLFAITVKVVVLALSIVGIATMWSAVFADTGVTILTILNTLRIMVKFKK